VQRHSANSRGPLEDGQGRKSAGRVLNHPHRLELATILKKDGATTLVITGTAANGAVMYTAFHANALGYTAAVPVDAISSPNPVQNNLAEWQMLNEPGYTNADNKPLAQNQVTLTRTDLITFK
jgi:1-aminocyclopropane-1-carboxylate deaminase/D-cysteine desulfhydrase-like pyridoxal-dependent ACC family enzyme